MVAQHFGGPWTIEKLDILTKYVNAYLTVLSKTPFKKIYIDAFAGSGRISITDGYEDDDVIPGSTRRILESEQKFDKYIFIDSDANHIQTLRDMVKHDFPDLYDRVEFICKDANTALTSIAKQFLWKSERAVLFIDPYATQFTWETLQLIGNTRAIDIWWLFPFSAVNRMLQKQGVKYEAWWKRLNLVFGDNAWEKEFYTESPEMNIFDLEEVSKVKQCNVHSVQSYIHKRLNALGFKVAQNSRILYNRNNSPLFIFFFIVTNDNVRAQAIALRIASHILGSKK